jgi:hypothetical protein
MIYGGVDFVDKDGNVLKLPTISYFGKFLYPCFKRVIPKSPRIFP